MLAYSGSTWTAVVIVCSIFVPLGITLALVVTYFKRWRHDPDAERMRRAHDEYRRTNGAP